MTKKAAKKTKETFNGDFSLVEGKIKEVQESMKAAWLTLTPTERIAFGFNIIYTATVNMLKDAESIALAPGDQEKYGDIMSSTQISTEDLLTNAFEEAFPGIGLTCRFLDPEQLKLLADEEIVPAAGLH